VWAFVTGLSQTPRMLAGFLRMRFMFRSALIAAAAAFMVLATGAARAEVRGVGASFPSKVYARWIAQYQRDTGLALSYKPTGSGDGVKQISDRKVEFAGSDSPLPQAELAKRKLVQIPMVIGGIVPVVNLPGVEDGELKLDGPLLADILLGTVERWNDPRIVALNPGLRLPALPIKRVVRADKSGTTEGFTRYLSEVSPAFKAEIGAGQAPKWPGEVLTAEGNDGMVKTLAATEGGIAYVSYDRVVKDELAAVRLINGSGTPVAASEAGFRAAILDSDVSRTGNDLASLMNRPASGAADVDPEADSADHAEPADAERATRAMRFLYWCMMHGDDLTRGTGFAPLPVSVQSRLAARFTLVKPRDGVVPAYLVL